MELISTTAIRARLRDEAEDLTAGRMLLLADWTGEAPGGYLLAVAQTITAETMATMLREAAGMPWLALAAERSDALGLTPMGHDHDAAGSRMMVTFEARNGVTTGISAADRALTMRVAADLGSTAADIVTPGHVIPYRVEADGPPRGWSPAEAALELATFAGFPAGATLCQVMDEEGRPAGKAGAAATAERLGLRTVEAIDILDLRLDRSLLIERAGDETVIDSPIGPLRCVSYDDQDGRVHHALIRGDVSGAEPVPLQVATQDIPTDVFGGVGPRDALTRLEAEDSGLLVYLAAPRHNSATAVESTRQAHVLAKVLRDLGIAAVRRGAGADGP
ncbi:MAG: 3,4-dihydroxy-2-butanone-4-phosphate synthase [Solirubrobacterales bacterium]